MLLSRTDEDFVNATGVGGTGLQALYYATATVYPAPSGRQDSASTMVAMCTDDGAIEGCVEMWTP